ncbi:MAG: Ig-like domain-containing protein [Deltaproteobacteria bacterium]|nr:Ig-like domain-containing protein [Deltaproteobacteria bacterium]
MSITRTSWGRGFVAVALAAIPIGCGSEPGNHPGSPDAAPRVDANPETGGDGGKGDPAGRLTKTVGSRGALIKLGDVTLAIPAGAVASDVQITVTATDDAPPPGATLYSPIYLFEPEGLQFAQPVQVRFEHDGNPSDAWVYWSKPDGPGFDELPVAVSGNIVFASITHFSRGFVGKGLDLLATGDPASRVPIHLEADSDKTLLGCSVRLRYGTLPGPLKRASWEVNGPGSVEMRAGEPWYVPPSSLTSCASAEIRALLVADRTCEGTVAIEACPSSLDLTPSSVTVPPGALVTFTATVAPSGLPISWHVNDVTGGNATLGFIGSAPAAPLNGIYVAPLDFPPTADVISPGVSAGCMTSTASVRLEKLVAMPPLVESKDPGDKVQLKVTARFHDGAEEDITALPSTTYVSGNEAVATVDAKGLVTTKEVGEARIDIIDTRADVPGRAMVVVKTRSRIDVEFEKVSDPGSLPTNHIVSALPGERFPARLFLIPQRGPGEESPVPVSPLSPDLEVVVDSGQAVLITEGPVPDLSNVVAGLDLARGQVIVGGKTGEASFRARYLPDGTTDTLHVKAIALTPTVTGCRRSCQYADESNKPSTEAVISPVPEHPLDMASLNVVLHAPSEMDYATAAFFMSRYSGDNPSDIPGHYRDRVPEPQAVQFQVIGGLGYIDPQGTNTSDYNTIYSCTRKQRGLSEGAPLRQVVPLTSPRYQGGGKSLGEWDLRAGACAVVTGDQPLLVLVEKGGLVREDVIFTVNPRFPEGTSEGGFFENLKLRRPGVVETDPDPGYAAWHAPSDIEGGEISLLNDAFLGGFRLEVEVGFSALTPFRSPRGQLFFVPLEEGYFENAFSFRAVSEGAALKGPVYATRSASIGGPAGECTVAPLERRIVFADGESPPGSIMLEAADDSCETRVVTHEESTYPDNSCEGRAWTYLSGMKLEPELKVEGPTGGNPLGLLRLSSPTAQCHWVSGYSCYYVDYTQWYTCPLDYQFSYDYVPIQPIPPDEQRGHLPGYVSYRDGPIGTLIVSSFGALVVSPSAVAQATDRAVQAWDDPDRRPPGTSDPTKVTLRLVGRSDPQASPLPAGPTDYRVYREYSSARLSVAAVASDPRGGKLVTINLPPATLVFPEGKPPAVQSEHEGEWIIETRDGKHKGRITVSPGYYAFDKAGAAIPLNAKPPVEKVRDFRRPWVQAPPDSLLRIRLLPAHTLRLDGDGGTLDLPSSCLSEVKPHRPSPLGETSMEILACPRLELLYGNGSPLPFVYPNPTDLLLVNPWNGSFPSPPGLPTAVIAADDKGVVRLTSTEGVRPDGIPDLNSPTKDAERVVLLQDGTESTAAPRLVDVQPFTLYSFVGLPPELLPTNWSQRSVQVPIPNLSESDPGERLFWFEGDRPIGLHVDTYVNWWATKENAGDRAGVFDGDCAYSPLAPRDLSTCRDIYDPTRTMGRVRGQPTGGDVPFGYELDGVACDPRWQSAVPLMGYDCNSEKLFGGVGPYGEASAFLTSSGLLEDAGGTSGGFVGGGEGRLSYQIVAETPGVDLYDLDVAYLSWGSPAEMRHQDVSKVNMRVVRFSEDDLIETSGEPDQIVTTGVAVTGPGSYVEMTTLPRGDGGAPLVAADLLGATLMFTFVPEGSQPPFQLDAIARKDRKGDVRYWAKKVLGLVADLACTLATGGTINAFGVAWAVGSTAAKMALDVPSVHGLEPKGLAYNAGWKVSTGIPKGLINVGMGTSTMNALKGAMNPGLMKYVSKSVGKSGLCSLALDALLLSHLTEDKISSAQASGFEILTMHLPEDTGDGVDVTRSVMVGRPFTTGPVVQQGKAELQQAVRHEDPGLLAIVFGPGHVVDGAQGTYFDARGTPVSYGEPYGTMSRFTTQVGGSAPTRFPFSYSAVAAAGRANESGAARIEMRRQGRFVLVPLDAIYELRQ